MLYRPDRNTEQAQLELSNHLNAGLKKTEFVSSMARDHRTLQAEFTHLCFLWLERAAQQYQDKDYDARNELECQRAFELISKEVTV